MCAFRVFRVFRLRKPTTGGRRPAARITVVQCRFINLSFFFPARNFRRRPPWHLPCQLRTSLLGKGNPLPRDCDMCRAPPSVDLKDTPLAAPRKKEPELSWFTAFTTYFAYALLIAVVRLIFEISFAHATT